MARRTKRANGEGSIYRRPDGLWCGQVVLPSGKRRTVYGKQRRTVAEKVAEMQRDPHRVCRIANVDLLNLQVAASEILHRHRSRVANSAGQFHRG